MSGVKGRSGRKPASATRQEVVARLSVLTRPAHENVKRALDSEDERVRWDATKWVLEQHIGRPVARVEESGPDGGPLRVAAEGVLTPAQEAMLRDMLERPERYAAALGLPSDGGA